MKKIIMTLFIFLIMGFLTACSSEDSNKKVKAFVEEGEHYKLEVSAVTVDEGENASFYIDTETGYSVVGVDYSGEYELYETRGLTKLVLKQVKYPTRIRLTLAFDTRSITYNANGGEHEDKAIDEVTINYDVSYHIRPNVSIGTDLFTREGYTLTGWNTKADGSGQRVGLGSRFSVEDGVTLYAQWEKWTDQNAFKYRVENDYVVIEECKADRYDIVVIPEYIEEKLVEVIDERAFEKCNAKKVIMPKSIKSVKSEAFYESGLEELVFFDNIEEIGDACFAECNNFSTVYINAIEDPYGYELRRESVWADKIDKLILTMGERRIIFYGGCSMWYNLDGTEAALKLGDNYQVLNMGLNGVVSSLLQMEIISNYVTEQDIIMHTPEISSKQQLLMTTKLSDNDTKLWCALEYNYDLVALLDLRIFESGFFDSFKKYLDKKETGGSYSDKYVDSKGREYLDETCSIPFTREESADSITDKIELSAYYLQNLSRLEEEYKVFLDKGVKIYVSYACIDIDQVPSEQQNNVALMGELYNDKFSAMKDITVISDINDFIYHDSDFYDTVYHLLTEPARQCTYTWLRDLEPYLN